MRSLLIKNAFTPVILQATNKYPFSLIIISKALRDKLINFYLYKLSKDLKLHDKVEFEIVTTCYDFDFDGKAKKHLDGVLDKEELDDFKMRLKDLTYPLLRGDCDTSIKKCLDKSK